MRLLTTISICFSMMSTPLLAALPKTITLGGVVYGQVSMESMGNNKISQYLSGDETLNNWTSMVAIHQFVGETNTLQFAQKHGVNASLDLIEGDENNVLQMFNTMNTPNKGDTITLQQNVWRYQGFSLGRGIMAISYSTRMMMYGGSSFGNSIEPINPVIIDEIKRMPLDIYQF